MSEGHEWSDSGLRLKLRGVLLAIFHWNELRGLVWIKFESSVCQANSLEVRGPTAPPRTRVPLGYARRDRREWGGILMGSV